MKFKLVYALLALTAVVLTTGMSGGCGEPIHEYVSYGSPNWMTDGRIVACKTVVREKQRGVIPGYMTYVTIFQAAYIVTMKDDGTDEKEIYGGEDKWGKISRIVASPLGNYIGYAGYANGQHNITIITADGSREVKAIATGELVNSFDWSPDETRIAYSGYLSKDLFILRVSDEVKTKIASSAAEVAWRVGEKIVYDGDWVNAIDPTGQNKKTLIDYSWNPQKKSSEEVIYEGKDGIYSIKIDGTANTKLFSNYEQSTLKLSFDNTKIAGDNGIWIVNIDGTNLRKLRD